MYLSSPPYMDVRVTTVYPARKALARLYSLSGEMVVSASAAPGSPQDPQARTGGCEMPQQSLSLL